MKLKAIKKAKIPKYAAAVGVMASAVMLTGCTDIDEMTDGKGFITYMFESIGNATTGGLFAVNTEDIYTSRAVETTVTTTVPTEEEREEELDDSVEVWCKVLQECIDEADTTATTTTALPDEDSVEEDLAAAIGIWQDMLDTDSTETTTVTEQSTNQ